MKILIIDDENFQRLVLKRLLNEYFKGNLQIFEAVDGYEGYLMFKKFKPDIVITDIIMRGGTGGAWLIENILKYDNKAQIIVISGQDQMKILKFKLMGAKACLTKPVKYKELYKVIDEILENKNQVISIIHSIDSNSKKVNS